MPDSLSGQTALVTGASSGLGADFARHLAARGADVVLVARREDRLQRLRQELQEAWGVTAHVVPMDLAEPEAPPRLHAEMDARGLAIDVLVNNAGYGLYGYFLDIEWERETQMLQLDIVALTHLTRLFARDMVERGHGYVLQVASIGAYQPSPTYASYSAAKAYVLNYGEAINHELRGTGVSCTVLSPGITETEFLEVSGQSPSLYQRVLMMDSETVTRIGVEAMLRRRSSVVPGLLNKLTIQSNRLMPRRLSAAVGEVLMEAGQ